MFKTLDFFGEKLDVQVHVLVDELLLVGQELRLRVGHDSFDQVGGLWNILGGVVLLEVLGLVGDDVLGGDGES